MLTMMPHASWEKSGEHKNVISVRKLEGGAFLSKLQGEAYFLRL